MIDRICAAILARPAANLIVVGLITVFMASAIPSTKHDASVRSFILDNDPDYAMHNRYKETFGQELMLVVAFEDDDIFTNENMETVRRLTERLKDIKVETDGEEEYNVYDVRSLTNAEYMKGTEDSFEAKRLVEELPATPPQLAKARDIATTNPLFVKDLVSTDGRRTSLIVTLRATEENYEYHEEVAQIEKIVAEEADRSGRKIHVVGEKVIDIRFLQYIQKDLQRFIPLTYLVLGLLTFVMFRNVRDTVIAIISISASLAWIGGTIPLAGYMMNSVNAGLPSLVLCIAVTDVVHIIHRYRKNLSGTDDRARALHTALKEALIPCFLTSFTTAIGFGSLAFNEISPISGFGFLASVGVSAAFVVCIVTVPSLLLLWKERSANMREDTQFVPKRMMTSLAGLLVRRRNAVIAIAIVLMGIAVTGALRIRVQSDRITYLRKSDALYKAVRFIENGLAGTTELDIWIEGGQDGIIKEPRVLREIEKLAGFLRSQPEVDKVLCVNDFFKEMNKAFYEDNPERYELPDTRAKVAQFMLIYSMSGRKNELDKYMDYPSSRTRVSVRSSEHNSEKLDDLIRRIRRYLKNTFEPPVRARLASLAVVHNNVFHYVLKGLLYGLLTAIILIFAVMCVNFTSLRVGLVSMVPNLIPIVAALGVMGLCGLHLEIATAMTFSIAIGIAVDDTIHFLTRFRTHLARARDYPKAVHLTLEDIGSALVETTAIMIGGFLVLLFASLRMNVFFGLLCAFIVSTALLADLTITPVCMLIFRPFGKPEDLERSVE